MENYYRLAVMIRVVGVRRTPGDLREPLIGKEITGFSEVKATARTSKPGYYS